MPRRSYDDLLRAFARRELAPAYYFHGAEDVLKDEAVRTVIDLALEPHERDFNLDQRSAAGLDPESLHALVNTLPMLAARRVVVLRDAEALRRKSTSREVLERYLANPSPDTVLVVVEGAPANEEKRRDFEPDADWSARALATDFEPLEGSRVARWIAVQARQRDITFGDGAAEHLAAAALYDLGAVRSELEKFAALPAGVPVTREQVGELVGVRHGETVEDWVEAVMEGATAKALGLVRRILGQSGMSGVRMVIPVGTALIGTRLARAHHDRGVRGGALERVLMNGLRQVRPWGLGDWRATVGHWSRWSERWSGEQLRAGIVAALGADTALKGTTVSDEVGILTDLVLRLSLPAEPRAAGRPPARAGDPALIGR